MEGIWKFLVLFFVIYVIVKLVLKYYGKAIMRFVLRKIGKRVERKFREAKGFDEARETGKTTITHKPQARQSINKEVGEYIDYEEID